MKTLEERLLKLSEENEKLRERVSQMEMFMHAFIMDGETIEVSGSILKDLTRCSLNMEELDFLEQQMKSVEKITHKKDFLKLMRGLSRNRDATLATFDAFLELALTLREKFPDVTGDPEQPFMPNMPVLFHMLHTIRAPNMYSAITRSMAIMIRTLEKLPPRFRNHGWARAEERILWREHADIIIETLAGREPSLHSLLLHLDETRDGAVDAIGHIAAYGADINRMKLALREATQGYILETAKDVRDEEKNSGRCYAADVISLMRDIWTEFEVKNRNGGFELEDDEIEAKKEADKITNLIKDNRNAKTRIIQFPIHQTKKSH